MNQVTKAESPDILHVALAFPDAYEIGMSYLGMKILYSILNSRHDIWAERVFMPMPDMEAELGRRGIPLYALESKRPLSGFDIVGFSLPFELCYTNILHMLRMGGLPVKSAERDPRHPLVIAGGPCACNPEPLADFVDAFFVGEAEQGLPEICDLFRSSPRGDRAALLDRLSSLEGIYVPSLYSTGRESNSGMRIVTGPIKADYPFPVKRRVLKDLDTFPFPERGIVPHHEVVHDRYSIEIARGCNEGCRFCQAGFTYRPYRERSREAIRRSVAGGIRSTGYNEVTLLSLNSGEFDGISGLAGEISREGESQRVSVSMPSLKVSALSQELADSISTGKKSGFTIAPEAGTQRMRDSINKDVTEEDLLRAVDTVFSSGWNLLKLYFIIGLPGETEEDLRGIVELAAKAARVAKRARGGGVTITLSTSSFVPKPFTPLQWRPMERAESLLAKQSALKAGLRRPVAYKWHPVGASLIEALYSLGDRRLGATLEEAARLGCKLDAWTEHFKFELWQKALISTGVDLDSYLYRERGHEEFLPWDVIDIGVSKRFLLQELAKSTTIERTPACSPDNCSGCGAPVAGICASLTRVQPSVKAEPEAAAAAVCPTRGDERPRGPKPNPLAPDPTRVRIGYKKARLSRFIGHLDLVDVFVRALRRASVKLSYSSGFHTMPKIELAAPLPLGVEGRSELMEISLQEPADCSSLAAALNGQLPEGITVTRVWLPGRSEPKLASLLIQTYEIGYYGLAAGERLAFEKTAESFMDSETWTISKLAKGKTRSVDLRGRVLSMTLDGERATVKISTGGFMDLLGVLTTPEAMEKLELARLSIEPAPPPAPGFEAGGGG